MSYINKIRYFPIQRFYSNNPLGMITICHLYLCLLYSLSFEIVSLTTYVSSAIIDSVIFSVYGIISLVTAEDCRSELIKEGIKNGNSS